MTQKVITALVVAAFALFWFWPLFRGRPSAKNNASVSDAMSANAQSKAAPEIQKQDMGSVKVSAVSKDQRATSTSVNWTDANAAAISTPAGAETIVVDPSKKFQKILGFGGAFTDAACYMFDQLPADARTKLFHDLFHPSKLGLNLNRTCIGASDYATHVYSYDEGEADPDLKRFSIAHDKKYILPMIRQARAVNPDIFLFSSPWSPPGWMKSNKSMLGGNMQRIHMPAYANYFAKFLKAYAKEGVPVQAVTIQNEVDTDQDGRMPACAWPQEYEVDFVRYHLGPTLRGAALDTKIWIIDHNYNLWGRALASLEAEDLRKYCSGIAWHGYVGDAWRMSTVHDAYPDIDMFWTEGGPDYTNVDYGTDWSKWSKTFTGNLRNWCRGITVWNLALDEQGRPNIGPFPCGGLVTINSTTKEITYSGQYWALAQYSKFVKRGASRIDSTSSLEVKAPVATSPATVPATASATAAGAGDAVSHVAFQNEDGQKVMVVTNGGAARTIVVQDSSVPGKSAAIDLAADSVTTLMWH